jgi:hypothetical protein
VGRASATGIARAGADAADGGFERQVRDALAHLHDPTYLQTHPLARPAERALDPPSPGAARAMRRSLLDAVEALAPGRAGPGGPDAARRQRLLVLRYVEALDIPVVLARLTISRATYHREHRRALAAVASVVRERWRLGDGADAGGGSGEPVGAGPGPRPVRGDERWPHFPRPLTSFVGRQREVAEVKRLLTKDEGRWQMAEGGGQRAEGRAEGSGAEVVRMPTPSERRRRASP